MQIINILNHPLDGHVIAPPVHFYFVFHFLRDYFLIPEEISSALRNG